MNRVVATITVILWLCLPTVLLPSEGDWPHLRGPNYDAVSAETGLIGSWPPTGPSILWRINLGQGYSGFIAVDDKLYTQMQTRSGQYVVCLDAMTGRKLWRHRYGWPWQAEGDYPGPYATPTYHAGSIYFAGTDGLIGCLDAQTGRSLWSVNVVEKFRGRGVDFGYACSPLVEDGKVILPVGGIGASVVALDARDGSVVWKAGDEPASYCSAYPISLDGRRQIVTFLQNALVGLDLTTGRQLWERRSSEGYDEHAAWPLYQEPLLLTFSPFHAGAKLLRLERHGDDTVAGLAWESDELSNDILSSVLLNGHVYGFDIRDYQANEEAPSKGQFKCMEFATGKVRWATDRIGHATVIAADGKLILLNDTGTLVLARATPIAYEELCRTEIEILSGGLCWTVPMLHHGRLYLRNQREAICVSLSNGSRFSATQTTALRTGATGSSSRWRLWTKGFPYAPEVRDLTVWYIACVLGSLLPASVALGRNRSQRPFWAVTFVLGCVGTILWTAVCDRFVFTWPAALFVAYHLALQMADRAQRDPAKFRRASLAAGLSFLGVCAAHFYLCKILLLVAGWGFFFGFLVAWPVSVYASRRFARDQRAWPFLLLLILSFSIYFWTSGAFTIWRMRRGL